MNYSLHVSTRAAIATIFVLVFSPPYVAQAKTIGGIEVDDRVDASPNLPGVNLAMLVNGDIVTVANNRVYCSSDLGQTWNYWSLQVPGHSEFNIPNGVICATENGALTLVAMDFSTYNWSWNSALNAPNSDCSLDVWAMRSLDGGHTWVNTQQLLDGYCGALQDMIQAGTGELIVPVQPLLYDQARHATQPFYSSDDGATWQASDDLLDIGGRGHHDGTMEASMVELQDGRTWMLARTNLDQFYSSYSSDGGRTWSDPEPSQIDASSSPGFITRLASGRLAMVWNRLYPEGETSYPRISGQYSATPASWMRHELSLALSEDDGQTWTTPVVIARLADGQRISYPHIFEPTPGRIWIATEQGGARLAVNEADFAVNFNYVFSMPAPPSVDDLARLHSLGFLYKYEYDIDPTNPMKTDIDGNSIADWAKGGTGPITLLPKGTVVLGSSAYYESGIVNYNNLWPNAGFTIADGYTLEWRMKVLSDTGSRGAFALVAAAADSTELPVLEIGDTEISFIGLSLLPAGLTADNAGDFHIYRLVRDASAHSGKFWLWRDGELLTPNGFYCTQTYERNALYFGDIGAAYDGSVEIDYFRLTPGAFAPLLIPGDANGDGKVDNADAAALAANWHSADGATWAMGDFNDDGKVDDADAAILAANWQKSVTVNAPEPGLLPMLLPLLGIAAWRRFSAINK